MIPEITHKVFCDNEDCNNLDYECDAFSVENELITMYCGVCGTDITHTAVPIN